MQQITEQDLKEYILGKQQWSALLVQGEGCKWCELLKPELAKLEESKSTPYKMFSIIGTDRVKKLLEVKDFPTLIIYEYGFEVKREVGYFNIKAM